MWSGDRDAVCRQRRHAIACPSSQSEPFAPSPLSSHGDTRLVSSDNRTEFRGAIIMFTRIVGSMFKGGLIVGGIGFCAGFFGPMVFAPDANRGPLLGIFITGPLGALLGAIGGVIYRNKPALNAFCGATCGCAPCRSDYRNSTRPRGLSIVAMIAGADAWLTFRSGRAHRASSARGASGCSARSCVSVAPFAAVSAGCVMIPSR